MAEDALTDVADRRARAELRYGGPFPNLSQARVAQLRKLLDHIYTVAYWDGYRSRQREVVDALGREEVIASS